MPSVVIVSIVATTLGIGCLMTEILPCNANGCPGWSEGWENVTFQIGKKLGCRPSEVHIREVFNSRKGLQTLVPTWSVDFQFFWWWDSPLIFWLKCDWYGPAWAELAYRTILDDFTIAFDCPPSLCPKHRLRL